MMAYNSYLPAYPQYSTVPATNNYPSYTQPQTNAYPQTQQTASGIIWVDGEVGAKAYQIPAGWPANTPLPLWDTNDTVIYLKSFNPVGMPNPLQKIHYRMEDNQQSGGVSCAAMPSQAALPPGDSAYVTRDDLEKLKEELRETITESMNQNTAPVGSARKGGKANESSV